LPSSATGDRQRLALRAGFLDPVVAAAGSVTAITDFRDDAFQPDLAGVLIHLATVDFEAFAELQGSFRDKLFELRLALDQRQLPQIVTVEIEQVEGDQDDLVGFALQLILQHREVCAAVIGWHHDLAVNDRAAGADMPGLVGDLPESLRPVMSAAGVDLHRFINEMHLDPIAIELDFVNPASAGGHFVDRGCERWLDESGEGCLDADRSRLLLWGHGFRPGASAAAAARRDIGPHSGP
jgi:hypothetical protein